MLAGYSTGKPSSYISICAVDALFIAVGTFGLLLR